MKNNKPEKITITYLAMLYGLNDVNHTVQKSRAGILRNFGIVSTLPDLKLYIKYMVSLRCKMLVADELKTLHIPYTSVELGMVEMKEEINPAKREELRAALLQSGLELMDDKRAILIEKIKQVIIEMIHCADELPAINYSDYIAQKLQLDYTYLSNIFSETKGITIQHYIILHKIEKAKELLLYNELTLTQISYMLHYSSTAHLSSQFKKVTGLTPSYFKQLKQKRNNNLENL